MTGRKMIGRTGCQMRPAAALAVLCAVAAGCAGRPLSNAGADGAAVGAIDAASDAGTPLCQLTDLPQEFAICGGLPGGTLAYATTYSQLWIRDAQAVRFEVMSPDGVWATMWGGGSWMVDEPTPLSGWLLWPPGLLPGTDLWLCGEAGSITLHANTNIDATLDGLSLMPRCTGAGGAESIQVDLQGGVTPFQNGGGCMINFTANGTRNQIFASTCPEPGVPFPLDGLRMIEKGVATDATACIGSGATLTVLPDPSPPTQHLVIDIPSLSEPEVCGPSTGGQVLMRVNQIIVNLGG